MSRDSYLDRRGDEVDLVLCDYCPDGESATFAGASSVDHWTATGWDIDPRPGRDRCPDCVTQLDVDSREEAPTNDADRQVQVPAGVP